MVWAGTSSATTYVDSRFIFQDAFQVMNERLEFFAQARDRRLRLHPASTTNVVLEPSLQDFRHPHHIDLDAVLLTAMPVASKRLSCHNALESRFFFGLANRRVSRTLSLVDRSLRHAPALAARGRHQRHFHMCLSNAIGDYRGLLMASHQPSVARTVSTCRFSRSATNVPN